MTSALVLRPDLEECLLEDRILMYAGPGLYPSQFIPTSGGTPSFVVSGFQSTNSTPGTAASTAPGPQFFFLQIGAYTTTNGGIRAGGSLVIFNPPQVLPQLQGPGTGSGANDDNATGGAPTGLGFGGQISSGYNTSLNQTNNFGMSTTAVGSVAAHVSGTTDSLMETQAAGASTTPTGMPTNVQDPNTPPTNPVPTSPGNFLTPMDRLLGKDLGKANGLLIGPGSPVGP